MIGEHFGRYEILAIAGAGGMATVYQARHRDTAEIVALKVIHPHIHQQDEKIRRYFERETKILRQLNHPTIVRVRETGFVDNQPFIAMEYMAGGTLAEKLKKPRNLSLGATSKILHRIATALDYAHQKGIVHRDVKPENILLDKQQVPYLSDFGVARLVDEVTMTNTAKLVGTPLYIAPEQIKRHKGTKLDGRVDVYGLAVMAYLLTTGAYPFYDEDSIAVIFMRLDNPPVPPTDVNPDLPPELNGVLLKGLARNREKRYAHATDFAKAFSSAVSDVSDTRTRIDLTQPTAVDVVSEMFPRLNHPESTVRSTKAMRTNRARRSTVNVTPKRSWSGQTGYVATLSIVLVSAVVLIGLLLSSTNRGAFGQFWNSEPTLDATGTIVAVGNTATAFAWTNTPTNTVTPSLTPTFTLTSTFTDTVTPSLMPTLTPTPTPSYTPTVTPSLTPTRTFTPIPTETPLPTATPTQAGHAVVSTFANLQWTPLGRVKVPDLSPGTRLWLLGRSANNFWYEVATFNGNTGWIYYQFIDINSNVSIPPITWNPTSIPPTARIVPTATPIPFNSPTSTRIAFIAVTSTPIPFPTVGPGDPTNIPTIFISVSGTLRSGVENEHLLSLQSGQTVTIDMTSDDFDTYLYFDDPNGRQVASDDDGGLALNSRIVYRATRSGTYTIRASSYGGDDAGRYLLEIDINP